MLLLSGQVVKDVKVQAHAETIDNSSNSKAVSTASGYKYNKHYWHTNNQNKPSTGNDALLNEGNTSNNTDATINNKFMAEVEQAIFNKVNEERTKAGVAPLTYNTTMEKYARIKSQDMGDNNYFSHTDLNGNNITAKMKADGVTYKAWGRKYCLYKWCYRSYSISKSIYDKLDEFSRT